MVPLNLGLEFGTTKVEMVLTCTYEGSRPVKGQTMGMIGLTGTLRRRQGGKTADVGGSISGKAHFAIEGGYLSETKLKVEFEIGGGGPGSQIMELALTRATGNTTGYFAPQTPPTIVKENPPPRP